MRFIPEIDVPESLIQAQQENKLVIFAGAGISVDSDLWDFGTFAIEAGKRFHLAQERNESIERFLGRLAGQKYPVHEFAAEHYSTPDAKPTNQHANVIKLFGREQNCRVVTTNWDPLLSQAAENVDKAFVPYHAPALPPGANFDGIVWVHGCVSSLRPCLVMTDEDFGRAYLTEGWARRFLLPMFLNNTVLFYGYRHDDTMLTYLARALPPESERYAFSLPENRSKWDSLGIRPILCSTDDKNEFHRLQANTIGKWTERAHASLLDKEARIGRMADDGPPQIPGDADYIKDALSALPTTRFFCRHAANVEWLNWLDGQKMLEALFDPQTKLTEIEKELAEWICRRFVIPYSDNAFEVIQRHGQFLNPEFWRRIVRQLTHNDTRPDPLVMSRWVTLLLKDVPPDGYSYHSLDYLMKDCKFPEESEVALQLLNYLLEPVVAVEPSLNLFSESREGDKVEFRLTLRGDGFWLRDTWGKKFKATIGDHWRKLIFIVSGHLSAAHTINVSLSKADGEGDTLSWWRSAIEKHEQDRHPRSFDALIDAARDVLEYVLTHHPVDGKALVGQWFNSEVPILTRLAVHGVAVGACWTPDEKIEWLIENELIYRLSVKHEVYQVIRDAASACTSETLAHLVACAEEGIRGQ